MKIVRSTAWLAAGLLVSGSLWAGDVPPTATISMETVTVGPGTGTFTVTYNDTVGTPPDAGGFAFTINYDSAQFSVDPTTGCSFTVGTVCDTMTAGTVSYGLLGFTPVADGTVLATITFDKTAAVAGSYPVTFAAGAVYNNTATFADEPLTTVDGNITVSTGPGPGILNVQPPTLALTAEVNGAAATGTITVSNDELAGGASITPSCSLGAVSGTGTITVTGTPGTLAPGTSSTVTANCSGTAVGTATATYTCTAAGAVVTNDNTAITCDVATGVPLADPAPGSTVNLTVGPIIRGATGTGSLIFRELNNSGGSYDVSCNAIPGTDFVYVGATSATGVTASTPFTLTVSGTSTAADPQPTATTTCDYTGGVTGTVTVVLGIGLVPEIVPTLSQWGLILMILTLVGFGAWQVRRVNG
ncbi:MAG: IPTL-CTERM sorting domain-containing protein [Xanthomonadales bacterium]|nr:IPTL-CTERM sorting domain-containing protein [Xanthomonadales bacterium]